MSFTWNNFAYQITLDMDNDSWIEEIVANMMFEDCLMEDANEQIKLDHMKVDGSGPRSVKRSDYSRGKKEIKPNCPFLWRDLKIILAFEHMGNFLYLAIQGDKIYLATEHYENFIIGLFTFAW
jgi:hypothetical protein